MKIIVFDMADLAFCHDLAADTLSVSAPQTGVLATLPFDKIKSTREMIFAALDVVLKSGSVPAGNGQWLSIALYNPISFQVAVGSVPDTKIYSCAKSLSLEPFGTISTLTKSKLTINDIDLVPVKATAFSTHMTLAAHK
jgi:hypothetical protein